MFDNLRRLLVRAHAINNHQSVLDNAIGIQMINQVEGDYLEFGVFKGARMTQAYETAVFLNESVNKANKAKDPYLHKISAKNLESMRFIGFDSFEGLPKAGALDVAKGQEEWLGQGGFSAGLEEVRSLLPKKGLADGRIKLVKGWFNETCTDATKRELELKSASIVYIDSDYYESAVPGARVRDRPAGGRLDPDLRRLVPVQGPQRSRRTARLLRVERAPQDPHEGLHPGHGDVLHDPTVTVYQPNPRAPARARAPARLYRTT